jgi:DNA primase
MISTGSTFSAPGDLRRLYLRDVPDDPNVCVKDYCPFHTDDSPSYGVFADHAYCFGCRRFEGYFDFCTRVGVRPTDVDEPPLVGASISGGGRRSGKTSVYTESQLRDLVEFYRQQLVSSGKQSYYESRGLSTESITKYALGYTGRAFAIPIWFRGSLQTIRFRRDDEISSEGSKYWGIGGLNNVYLFAPEGTEADQIILCEGELDCLLMCQLGYTAVTVTNGAGSTSELSRLLLDSSSPHSQTRLRELVIALDQDSAGFSAALDLKKSLSGVIPAVRIARWFEKDLTDLYRSRGLVGVTRALGSPPSTSPPTPTSALSSA